MSTEPQHLLHITHACQDEAWVRGVLLPGLGLAEGQYWTRAEDDVGALKLEELERAVQSCRYTLLVASSAARVDQWAQFAGLLAERLGIEKGKPGLLLVARDFVPGSERARELLPLRQRCLVCLDCSDPERTPAALKTLAARLTVTTTEAPATECPYPGLRMFGAGDPASCFNHPDLFFGRDDEAQEIVDQLRGDGRVLLVGPSGCGKSSLVRARVLPALGQGADAMAIAVARPGAHPDVALRAALDALDPRLGPVIDAYLGAEDKQAAVTALVAATAGPRRLVYLDQLEEVFLDEADEHGERGRFFARLAALGRVPGVAILLGMRADFYGDLMRSPAWDDFKDHRVELAPLRGAALRLAITRPAEVVGVYVEPDLVERLVREADLDRAAEALPLLQVALEQLWAQREWRYLSLASYERIADGERRGLDVVLARHADATIAALAGPAQTLARRVLIDLVHLGEGRPDTRRRRTSSELCRAGDDSRALGQVLDHLSARRLIAISAEASQIAAVQTVALEAADADHTRHVDLAHDTLITGWLALAGWIRARRDDLRTQRRLEARAAGGGLLAASELPEFTRWVAWIATPAGQALGTSDALHALVRHSVAARRFRRSVFGIGLVAATAFAIVFGIQARHLREERTTTQRSINVVGRAAELIVFEVDIKLQALAGTSSVRETLLRRSRELLAELRELAGLGEHAQHTAWAAKVAQAVFALERGHLKKAHELYLEALMDAQQRAATDSANARSQGDLSVSYEGLGNVAATTGKLGEAQDWFDKALAVRKTLAAVDPTNASWQLGLSVSYDKLGDVAVTARKLDDARAWFDKALAVRKTIAAAHSANAAWQQYLSLSYQKLGDVAVTARKLDDAHAWFDREFEVDQALAAADPTNADWQHDLSTSYDRLGDVAVSASKLDDARTWFDKALAVRKALAAADPTNTGWQRDLSVSYDRLGDVAVSVGKLDDAQTWFDKALAVREALAAADPANTGWQRDLSASYDKLGDVAVSAGKLDDARTWFDKALAVHKALTATNPANAAWQHDLSLSYQKLGDVAVTARKLDDARAWFDKALAVHKALATADPTNTGWQRDLSVSYDRLGDVAVSVGKLDDARAWFDKALAVRKALAAADPANTGWQRDLSVSYDRLGDVAVSVGKLDDARAWFDKALAVRKALAAADPANTGWQRDLSVSYEKLGDVAVSAGKLDDAHAWFDKALTVRKTLAEADPTNTDWQHRLSVLYERLGDIAVTAGKLDDAHAWFDKALAVRKALTAADPANADCRHGLVVSYTKLGDVCTKLGDVAVAAGKLDDAHAWFDKALAARRPLAADDPTNADWQRDLAVSYTKLGDVAVAVGKLDDARAWSDKALAVRKALAAADPANADWQRDLAISFTKLGDIAVTVGKLDGARAWFDKALAVRKALAAADPANADWQRDLAISFTKLGDIAMTVGKLDDARTWFNKALAIRKALTAADPTSAAWQGDLAVSYSKLGQVAETAGKLNDARVWFEKSLAVGKALAAHDPANPGRQRDLCITLTAIARAARDPYEAKRYLGEARIIHGRLQRGGVFQGDVEFARLGTALDRFTASIMKMQHTSGPEISGLTPQAPDLSTTTTMNPPSKPGGAEAAASDDLMDALVEAEHALAGGDYWAAKNAAQRAIRKGATIRAYANLAIAFCGLGDLGNAKAQLFHVMGPTLARVDETCKSLGVDLE